MRLDPTHLIRTLLAGLLLLALPSTSVRAAWTHDPVADGVQFTWHSIMYPLSTSDGAGGTFVVYEDMSTSCIWAQHMSATGVALWGSGGGIQISTAGSSAPESIIPDGAGGFICSWVLWLTNNYNVYAQRVNAAGTPLWTTGGVVVCNAANNQYHSVLAPDGVGGAYMAWQDFRANASASDVYAQHLNTTGAPTWAANGMGVCTYAGNQTAIGMVTDGYNGAYLSWLDSRGANLAVYVQRLYSNGLAVFAANGLALTSAIGNDEWNPVIVSDGRNGAIVAWNDWRNGNSDIYAQRFNSAGQMGWTANGVQVTTLASDQTNPVLVPDGASGVVVGWLDARNSSSDVYAQRLGALGTAQWTANGVALCTAGGNQSELQAVGDGSGGAIVGWTDRRNGSDDDIYAQHVTGAGSANWTTDGVALGTGPSLQLWLTLATDGAAGAIATYFTTDIHGCQQHVDRFGILGGAAPTIVSVDDVPNDQGGYVSIRWDKSWLDVMPGNPVSQYWLWRQVPQVVAQSAIRRGATLLAAGETPRGGSLRTTVQGAQTYYWEYLNYVNAQGQAGYSVIEPTRGDSVAASNPLTTFMVETRYAALTGAYWDSDPVASYSVDNLAPATPAPFTGTWTRSVTVLGWSANTEADLAGYRLYRGPSAGFVPGPANLVATPATTAYTDPASVPYFYKLAAVDIHGNESAYATLQPAGTTDVGPSAAHALALAAPAPNPAGTRTALAFTLPAAGPARLALYDAAGRCVRVFADGEQPAGEHRLTAELRDASGRALPAGLYLLRLEAAGRTLVRRLAAVR